jgi:protein-disulfide isomerase
VSTRSNIHSSRRERRALERSARSRTHGASITRAPTGSRWRSPLVLVSLGTVAVMAVAIGALLLSSKPSGPSGIMPIVTPPDTGLSELADGAALGAADAPVVLEVYGDYQCPWCGQFAREVLPGLARTFVASGQLRIEDHSINLLSRHSTESIDAATAATCAVPAGKYWEFHDYLMWNQSGEDLGAFSRERLFAVADRLGLDGATFAACYEDPTVRGQIHDRTAAAFAAGITSTPTFVLDGERVDVPMGELDTLIRARLEAAAAR